MLNWLWAPLSGLPQHHIESWAYWHARCMVLAWGVLLPTGALVARYFKVMPHQRWPEELDNRAWWYAHLGLQWSGVLAMTVGLLFAWGQGGRASSAALWHAATGWMVLALGWLQPMAGLVRGSKGGPPGTDRRGDHYDMTVYRRWFERLHKCMGWAAVLAAVGVIALGLWMADAPRWMPLALAAWWLMLAFMAARWQMQGRCIDTYQAIWGPDPVHPGNRRRPIGWGVRRPLERTSSDPT